MDFIVINIGSCINLEFLILLFWEKNYEMYVFIKWDLYFVEGL